MEEFVRPKASQATVVYVLLPLPPGEADWWTKFWQNAQLPFGTIPRFIVVLMDHFEISLFFLDILSS
jgi:hypothetical protein